MHSRVEGRSSESFSFDVQVMEQSGLFKSEAELLNVLAECDENEDGNIQYREFLPVMVQVGSAQLRKSSELQDRPCLKGVKVEGRLQERLGDQILHP